MTEIIPAILPKDYEDLKNRIALVRHLVSVVQIDLCDGKFVRSRTWPFDLAQGEPFLDEYFSRILNEQEGLPFWEDIDFEIDLMVADAVQNFDLYMKLGPRRIIFHVEAVGELENFKNFLEGIDMYVRDVVEIGVAINPDTSLETLFPLIPHIDFVQCMGIAQIGYQGEPFDERVLANIKTLKEKFSDVVVSVDGGVNLATGARLAEAGVDRLVA